jgi:hypothetical protein
VAGGLCPYAIDAVRRSLANDLDQVGDIDRRRHVVLVSGKPCRLAPTLWRLFTLLYQHRSDVVDNDRLHAELCREMEQPLVATVVKENVRRLGKALAGSRYEILNHPTLGYELIVNARRRMRRVAGASDSIFGRRYFIYSVLSTKSLSAPSGKVAVADLLPFLLRFPKHGSASGSRGSCLSDSGKVGTRNPSFQVSTDGTCCCTVAPIDALTVPNELGLEGRSRVTLIARRSHSVSLAHFPCVDESGVLPGEDLSGDAPERVLGMCDYVAVT